MYCSLRCLCTVWLSGHQIWLLHKPCKAITTAPNVWCVLWISSDLQIRGAGWIELILLLHAQKLHRLWQTYTELECFALVRAVQQHLWLQWAALPKMLCQWITSIFPPSQCTIFPGAGSRTVSHLLLIRWKWARIWKKWGDAFLFFATACLFSPLCLCLLREGSICTSCFWRAELRYCLLNAELCRIWTSFRNNNTKKIHCYYFEMLFVPTPNPAGFIYMCLLMISLFSANPTKQEFSVFPQLGLQPQFADKHRLARAVHSKGVSPCNAHRVMSSLCQTMKRRKMLAKWKKKIKLVPKKRTYL